MDSSAVSLEAGDARRLKIKEIRRNRLKAVVETAGDARL
jgi:hypothetical protein